MTAEGSFVPDSGAVTQAYPTGLTRVLSRPVAGSTEVTVGVADSSSPAEKCLCESRLSEIPQLDVKRRLWKHSEVVPTMASMTGSMNCYSRMIIDPGQRG
eukprot:15280171-Heterocapsa_arctica.AAC.1